MPSPGSAVLNCATAAEKVLPLPLPLHGKRLHQVFHREVRWVFPVQDGLHKGRRQVGQAQDPAHERWADVLGLGQVFNRRVGAIEQFAMPSVAARNEFDHGVVNERFTALDGTLAVGQHDHGLAGTPAKRHGDLGGEASG